MECWIWRKTPHIDLLCIIYIYIYINIYWNILDIIWSRCSLRKWHTIEASWLEEKFCFCSKHHHMVGWFISFLKIVGNNRSTPAKYSGNSCRFSDLCWQSPTMLMVERKSSRISMRLSSSPLTDISSNWLGKYEGLKHHWRRDLSHTRVGLAWDTSPVWVHTTHALWATKTTINWPLCNRNSRKPSNLKIKHSFCLHEWIFVDQLILSTSQQWSQHRFRSPSPTPPSREETICKPATISATIFPFLWIFSRTKQWINASHKSPWNTGFFIYIFLWNPENMFRFFSLVIPLECSWSMRTHP